MSRVQSLSVGAVFVALALLFVSAPVDEPWEAPTRQPPHGRRRLSGSHRLVLLFAVGSFVADISYM